MSTASPEASEYLREAGEAIHLYWLSGYIFFGSSERRVRANPRRHQGVPAKRVVYVVLDFGMVSASTPSAVMSLAKPLRNLCSRQGIVLVYCSYRRRSVRRLGRAGFFRRQKHSLAFADLTSLSPGARTSCSPRKSSTHTSLAEDRVWLQRQLGATVSRDSSPTRATDTDGSEVPLPRGRALR